MGNLNNGVSQQSGKRNMYAWKGKGSTGVKGISDGDVANQRATIALHLPLNFLQLDKNYIIASGSATIKRDLTVRPVSGLNVP